MMADTKTGKQSDVERDQELRPSNRRILDWIREQRADTQTDEDRAWAKRFRQFISEHRFELPEDVSE
jgi:hypothetical protein